MSVIRPIAAAALAALLTFSLNASAQSSSPPKRMSQVVLDSGVTLEDWLKVVSAKEPTPSLETASEAAQFVRRYGAFRQLLDIVHRATEAPAFDRATVTSGNAAQLAAKISQARRQLGDWPNLLLTGGIARAHTNDAEGAIADLRKWMKVAPREHPLRPHVADALISSERSPAAITAWAKSFEPVDVQGVALTRDINSDWMRYVDPAGVEMAKAVRCVGVTASARDVAFDWKGKKHPIPEWGVHYVQRNGALYSDAYRKLYVFTREFGPSWKRTDYQDGSIEVYRAVDVQCSGSLFPIEPGKKLTMRWKLLNEGYEKGQPAKNHSTLQNEFDVEVVSGPLTADDVAKLPFSLKVDPRIGETLRLYRARLTKRSWNVDATATESQLAGAAAQTVDTLLLDGVSLVVFPSGLAQAARGTRVTISVPK